MEFCVAGGLADMWNTLSEDIRHVLAACLNVTFSLAKDIRVLFFHWCIFYLSAYRTFIFLSILGHQNCFHYYLC